MTLQMKLGVFSYFVFEMPHLSPVLDVSDFFMMLEELHFFYLMFKMIFQF